MLGCGLTLRGGLTPESKFTFRGKLTLGGALSFRGELMLGGERTLRDMLKLRDVGLSLKTGFKVRLKLDL